MADKKFVDGMIVKRKPKAPDFVKCSLSFKCKEFYAFMKENNNDGWLNVDLKVSKQGKLYAEVDDWQPKKKDDDWDNPPVGEDTRDFSDGDPDDDIPFP